MLESASQGSLNSSERNQSAGIELKPVDGLKSVVRCASPAVVITLVFLTLLTVLVVIAIYLYRNQGSYRTYEQPEPDTAPREEAPPKDKEEYFI
uniref:Small cell adhesion glycoprotein n=1 Tax=Ficedula albicollis TaxID=59894 RepID=A0A803VI78_FICAL